MTAHPQGTARPFDLIKRLIDLVAAAFGLVVTAPVQAVVALMVRRKLGHPALFRQRRPGRYGEPFTLVKFRTMLDVDETRGMVADADRLTPFGATLRSTSLDELPTLWNVLRGDMSLVGPRPLLMRYLDRYTPEQARRHEVRPGITGLVQVSGRNMLSWEEKFAADLAYVDRRSLGLDIVILLRTLMSVIGRVGVSATGNVTMPEFFSTSSEPTSADSS